MLNIQILCIGKLKERYLSEASKEYQKRLMPYCKLETIELAEMKLPDSPSDAQISAALKKEGEEVLKKTAKADFRIALCVEGKEMSSAAFSGLLGDAALQRRQSVTFIIGGSHGLSEEVKKTCSLRLSFSPMTFPHHLIRVMLLEQIYRAFQIQAGGKYHK